MKLPNGRLAVIDLRKLERYCLNVEHRTGKHKAHVFRAVFGITAGEAAELQGYLIEAAIHEDATPSMSDQFDDWYVVDFALSRMNRTATVRSCWIVPEGDLRPWLTSCYVLPRRIDETDS